MALLIVVGLLSGICAALGLGGGFILLLYLTSFMFMEQQSAQVINLLFFIPIGFLAIWIHRRNHLLEPKIILPTILSGIVGSIAGVFLGQLLEERLLTILFALFVLGFGIKELFSRKGK